MEIEYRSMVSNQLLVTSVDGWNKWKDGHLRTRPASLPNPEVCIWGLLKTYIHVLKVFKVFKLLKTFIHVLKQLRFQSHLPVVCEVGDEECLCVHYDHPGDAAISQSVIIPSWGDTRNSGHQITR